MNVKVLVKLCQVGSSKYKSSRDFGLKNHVSNLLLFVPVEEQENVVDVRDIEVEKDGLKNILRLRILFWMMITFVTELLKVLITTLLMLRSKTLFRLQKKKKLTRNLWGMYPQVVAVLDLCMLLLESPLSSRPM